MSEVTVVDSVRGWESWLDRFRAALPGKVFVTLFGVNCECKISGDGMLPNGYYIELETTSVPEGYPVRFPLFDNEIDVELGSYVKRTYTHLVVLPTDDGRYLLGFDCSVPAAAYLYDELGWPVEYDREAERGTVFVDETGFEAEALLRYLETCWHTA